MHGYEMMKALEEKSGGFYVPSAGSIYPTLQMLEDRGLVTVAESEGGKKIYSITETGRSFLAEHKKPEEHTGPFGGHRGHRGGRGPGARWATPEIQALRSEAMEVARLAAIAGRMVFDNPEQVTHLRDILEHTRKDLSDMIYGANKTAESSSEPPTVGDA
jgi:DNA-binding PadR family transcriptional regulator